MEKPPVAFRMQLRPGCVAEYERRHEEIWPALADALRAAGIRDYSIFLDPETLALFAVMRRSDEFDGDALAALPIMRQWWDYMADLMLVQEDNRPTQWPLLRVFHLA